MMTGITEENFGQIWPVHLVGLTAFLTQLREAFDGDLEAALFMMVIGSATLPRGRTPDNLSYVTFQTMGKRGAFYKSLNTLSIADVTRIPRETVRRKLAQMEKRGWIRKDPEGFWRVERTGMHALEPMTQFALEYLNRMAAIIVAEKQLQACAPDARTWA